MHPKFLAILCLGFLSSHPSFGLEFFGANSVRQNAVEYKFETIFNGKDFNNWFLKLNSSDPTLITKTYGIKTDSGWVHVMKDLPDNYNPNTTQNLLGMMFTKEKYSKYVLRWEYKWGTKIMNKDGVFKDYQYDAGVYFHNTNDWIFPTGLEYQIRYDHTKNQNHTGDLITTTVIGDWYKKPNDWRFSLPEAGGVAERAKVNWGLKGYDVPYNALNEKWNKCELIVMGKEYALYKLNGKTVNYITNLSVGEGTFGFQAESAEIFYRNIEVMVTEASIPYSVTQSESFAPTGVQAKGNGKGKGKAPVSHNLGAYSVSMEREVGFTKFHNHSNKIRVIKIFSLNGTLISNGILHPGETKAYPLSRGVYSLKIQADQIQSPPILITGD